MCTVTIVPLRRGFRVACNRDERISRAPALPPERHAAGRRSMVAAIDGERGGTWIGVNDAGIVAALLNRTPAARRPGTGTRGEIVPRLLAADSLHDLLDRVHEIDPYGFDPFRLIALQRRRLMLVSSDGVSLTVDTSVLDAPRMFTSSSLGDDEAERRRAPLFAALVERARDPRHGQRLFHDHRWRDCPAFSVRMARGDARTVSRSVIDVLEDHVTFTYKALDDAAGAGAQALGWSCRPAGQSS